VVDELVQISLSGRAAKQNSLLFVLAMCARLGDTETRRLVYASVDRGCRIPTHVFMFIGFVETMCPNGTGWGRAQRRAICAWYANKAPAKLGELVTKYKQREGWSHVDVLRLSHVKPSTPAQALLYTYIVKGWEAVAGAVPALDSSVEVQKAWTFLYGVEQAKACVDEAAMVSLIAEHHLVREHIPTPLLASCAVWEALLATMPLTAMLRNLAKMTSIGLLVPDAAATIHVCAKLTDAAGVKQARIHPFNVLVALKTYASGHGDKGSLSWHPVPAIEAALSATYDLAFVNVEPTNKRFVLAMDISGSMSWSNIHGASSVTAQEGAAAMAMCVLRKEPACTAVAFCTELVPYPMTPDMSLKQLTTLAEQYSHRMGGTDCAQPMLWALKEKVAADVFVVYTDCETWAGSVHPSRALQLYREGMGIPDAKLIICAMTSNGFTLADPEDPGMLDLPGFDAAAPEIMRSFVLGQL
jgi:60 kDa SS-A/Ro ribonucleoprotein